MRGKAAAVLAFGVTTALAGAASAAEDLGGAAGFEARSVTYKEGQEPAGSVRVYMAPEGRRLEGIPPHGITLVAPAEGDRRWLVDADNERYAVDPSGNKGGTLGGVLSHEPCQGFAGSERLGKATLNGRETIKWECRHPNFGKVTQWFDPAINTVVRDRTTKGEIQELRQIQVGEQSPELFRYQPADRFEQVPVIRLFQP